MFHHFSICPPHLHPNFLRFIPPPPVCWSAAEATGLGFVCFVVITLQPTELILGFFLFHKFYFYSPPPPSSDEEDFDQREQQIKRAQKKREQRALEKEKEKERERERESERQIAREKEAEEEERRRQAGSEEVLGDNLSVHVHIVTGISLDRFAM